MIFHKIPTIQNVVASQTAQIPNIPLGMTYQGILFKLGGTAFTKANISEFRFRLDTKQFVTVSGSHLDAHNSYLNIPANANYLLVPFANFKMRSQIGEAIGSVDTSVGYGQFSAEIDIGAATGPTLDAWGLLTPPLSDKDPNKRTLRCILKATHAISAGGEFSLNVPFGSKIGALIDKLFMHHGGNVSQLQVLKDGLYLVQQADTSTLDYCNEIRNTRTPQADLVVWDTCNTDNSADMVSTLRTDKTQASFDVKVTTTAADAITSYSVAMMPIENV